MITIITDNHKKNKIFIKKQKRYLIYRYFAIAIYYQLESAHYLKGFGKTCINIKRREEVTLYRHFFLRQSNFDLR